jgi:uncharacterized membrane protein
MKIAPSTTVLSAAIGLAMTMQGTPTNAAGMQDNPEMMKQMMQMTQDKMRKEHLEQCYGINAVGKNDCGGGAHSCNGQATNARDPKSFVLVPVGLCSKIAGGRLKSS